MIRVFKRVVDEVGARGQVNPGSLANGIWEALITTAAGLSVAIPTYIAFRYLESRIDRVALDMEAYSASLIDGLGEAPAAAVSEAAAAEAPEAPEA
jgi:biopolymer transport protein ExbB